MMNQMKDYGDGHDHEPESCYNEDGRPDQYGKVTYDYEVYYMLYSADEVLFTRITVPAFCMAEVKDIALFIGVAMTKKYGSDLDRVTDFELAWYEIPEQEYEYEYHEDDELPFD